MIIQDPKTPKRKLPNGVEINEIGYLIEDFLYNTSKEQFNDYPKFWDNNNLENYQIDEKKLFKICYAYAMQLLSDNLDLGHSISRISLAKLITSWLIEDITWYKKRIQDSIYLEEIMISYAIGKGNDYCNTTSGLFEECFSVYTTKEGSHYQLNSDDSRLIGRIICTWAIYDVISRDKRVEFCKPEHPGACLGTPDNVSFFKIKI